MSIIPEKVRGRNNQLFGDIKKDISISLAQVREFITTVSQSKKSTRGFKSTCEQIEAFLANCNKSFEVVQKRINGPRGFVDAADSIDYNDDIDMMNGGVVEKLTRGVRNIEKYLVHFNKMVAAGETPKAALSIAKYKKEIVRVIDKTKEYNIKSEAAVKAYLASEQFLTALLDPESTIDITKGDLQGTEAAKKKFLLDIQERAGKQGHRVELEDEDNFFIEQADGKIAPIAADDEDEGAGDDKPIVEEDFNAVEKDDEDDDDDEASSDEREKKKKKEGSRESDDDDDDGDDCDASTTSDGGALFEGNIEHENADIVDEVEKTAYVVGGRTLRNNGRLQNYADIMKHNPDLRVGDYAESAPKKKSNAKRDETREYDSEISDSDGGGAVDEVAAYMKQIEEERARAAKKAKAAAAAATTTTTAELASATTAMTNGTKVKKEKRARADDDDIVPEQPQQKARTTELSNGSATAPAVKVKQEHVIMQDD